MEERFLNWGGGEDLFLKLKLEMLQIEVSRQKTSIGHKELVVYHG